MFRENRAEETLCYIFGEYNNVFTVLENSPMMVFAVKYV